MRGFVEKPRVAEELLDPAPGFHHQRVEKAGFTVDIVMSPGTRLPHRHAGIEVVVVHRGVSVWWIGDWLGVLMPGDALLFDASNYHGSRPIAGSYVRTTIHWMPDAIDGRLFDRIKGELDAPWRISLPDQAVASLFDASCRLRACQLTGSRGMGRERLQEVIGCLVEAGSAPSPASGIEHPVLRDVLQFMIERPDSEAQLSEVARSVFVSEGHLHHLFQKHLGASPGKVWRTIKVERACAEIIRRDRSVGDLARLAGFSSRRGIQRAFKRVTGTTVEDFRALVTTQAAVARDS